MPFDPVAQVRLGRAENADVVSDGQRPRLAEQAGVPDAAHRALGYHVEIEHHRVDAAKRQILVRVHVVFVRDGNDAVASPGVEQQVIRRRAPSVATRRPRRSASERNRSRSAVRTVRTSRNS